MTFCNEYCDSIIEILQSLTPSIKAVISHSEEVKDVPVSETIAAVGVKKCVIADEPDSKVGDDLTLTTQSRKILVTVGINLYVPYSKGIKESYDAFDKIVTCFLAGKKFCMNEAKMLGTKYSREAQCLVSETEYEFEAVYVGTFETLPL